MKRSGKKPVREVAVPKGKPAKKEAKESFVSMLLDKVESNGVTYRPMGKVIIMVPTKLLKGNDRVATLDVNGTSVLLENLVGEPLKTDSVDESGDEEDDDDTELEEDEEEEVVPKSKRKGGKVVEELDDEELEDDEEDDEDEEEEIVAKGKGKKAKPAPEEDEEEDEDEEEEIDEDESVDEILAKIRKPSPKAAAKVKKVRRK